MHDAPYRTIEIRNRKGEIVARTKVDPADYDRLARFSWWLARGYPARSVQRNNVKKSYLIHREIMGLTHGDGLEVDHINHDPLDNRRANLRICTTQENSCNLTPRTDGKSKYRGVTWCRRDQKWIASAYYQGHHNHLKRHAIEEDAARVVNAFWVERGYSAPNDLAAVANAA